MTEGRDEIPAEPRPAATVIIVSGGTETLEVLLVRRNPAQRFMGGAWVFPGGAVDAGEDARQAAVREAHEEANVFLDPAGLRPFSRWITPPQLPIRFDTHFFLERLPAGASPRADGSECVDLRTMAPRQALDDPAVELHFPTVRTLEQIDGFASAEALWRWAEGRRPEPTVPHVVTEGEVSRVVLPGEPGYGSAP